MRFVDKEKRSGMDVVIMWCGGGGCDVYYCLRKANFQHTFKREVSILSSSCCEMKILFNFHGVCRIPTASDGLREELVAWSSGNDDSFTPSRFLVQFRA